MSYLLDTNGVSELIKPAPDPRVLEWLAGTDDEDVYLSAATLAEIARGIELLDPGKKRSALSEWRDTRLATQFRDRVIPIDDLVARAWGTIMARGQRSGAPVSVMDGFIAATALAHDLVLVTRNVRHFDRLGISLFDPWNPAGGSR